MKYTIHGYSQEKSIESGLDYLDLGILRWIQDFYPAMKKTIFQNKEYGWFSYSYFLNELPIIGINTKAGLRKRIDKIIEKGFIERTCIKDTDDKLGTRSWIRLTEKMLIIISQTTVSTGNNHSFHPVTTTVSTGSNHSFHNSSINNPSINDSSFSNKDKDTASGFSQSENSVVNDSFTTQNPTVKESLTVQKPKKEIEITKKDDIESFVRNFKATEFEVDGVVQLQSVFSEKEIELITGYLLRRKEKHKSKAKCSQQAIKAILNKILEIKGVHALEVVFEQHDGCYVNCGTAGDPTTPWIRLELEYFTKLIKKPTFNNQYAQSNTAPTARDYLNNNKDYIDSINPADYF
jgi:hypothetical protein